MTEEERRALPHYGGNKIPESYLREWRAKHGYTTPEPLHDEMPLWLQQHLQREFDL